MSYNVSSHIWGKTLFPLNLMFNYLSSHLWVYVHTYTHDVYSQNKSLHKHTHTHAYTSRVTSLLKVFVTNEYMFWLCCFCTLIHTGKRTYTLSLKINIKRHRLHVLKWFLCYFSCKPYQIWEVLSLNLFINV